MYDGRNIFGKEKVNLMAANEELTCLLKLVSG